MKKFAILLIVITACGVTGHSQTVVGDVNGDGYVTSSDVTMIYNIMLGNSMPLVDYDVNGVTLRMVKISGGTFMMGATEDQGNTNIVENEYPVHQVTLSSFSIGQTEVTQELWQAVMGSNPSSYNGGSYGTNLKRPVENVSWDDCQEFIAKLNEITGENFRLPTEAEWEFAARGGNKSQGYKYAGSNTLDDVAWYISNSNEQTHSVATKVPNELGLYDMNGNVWEWCQDWFDENYYDISPSTNPQGPSIGTYRVLRGESFFSPAWQFHISYRGATAPNICQFDHGLRLAL